MARAPCARGLPWLASLCAAAAATLDGAALFQRGVEVHSALDEEGKRTLARKLTESPDLQGVLESLSQSDAAIRAALYAQLNSGLSISRDSLNASARGALGKSTHLHFMPAVPLDATGSNLETMINGLLDALRDDDFVRNFTKMSSEMQDLSAWLDKTGSGKVEMFLQNENGSSEEAFKVDTDRFVREWFDVTLSFLQQMVQITAQFTEAMPAGLLNGQDATLLSRNLTANISKVINTVRGIKPADMSKISMQAYCPHLLSSWKRDDEQVHVLRAALKQINVTRRMLPTIGQAWSNMVGDDPEAETMTPRLLFMIQQMFDYSYSLLDSFGSNDHKFSGVLAPYLHKRIGCSETDKWHQPSGSPRLGVGLLAALLPLACGWLAP